MWIKIFRVVVTFRQARAFGCFGERILHPAKAVDQTQLSRGTAIPDAALSDLINLGRRLASCLGDQSHEVAIAILDSALQNDVQIFAKAADEIGLA